MKFFWINDAQAVSASLRHFFALSHCAQDPAKGLPDSSDPIRSSLGYRNSRLSKDLEEIDAGIHKE
jgi:hypothetical protein